MGPAKEDEDDRWGGAFKSLATRKGNRCDLKPDPGPCKGLFERFYYDPWSRTCKTFFWGGCDGIVPFETEDECRKCIEDKGVSK